MTTIGAPDRDRLELLLIGGRSGVGKTTVAHELSEWWQRRGVAHCLVDGDNLGAAYPKPADDPDGSALTEANLRAVWENYAAAGHRRLVYVNTVSVLEPSMVLRAIGGSARVSGVLLTTTDETAHARLARREVGTALDLHVRRSATMAAHLDERAGDWVLRVPTDGKLVADIATAISREVLLPTAR